MYVVAKSLIVSRMSKVDYRNKVEQLSVFYRGSCKT